MTTREFYVNVLDLIDVIESDDPTGCVDTKLMGDKARELIAGLDAKNAKAKARPRKADPAVEERKNAVSHFVLNHVGEEFTADEIAEQINETVPMSPAAVASAMRIYVSAGRVTKGVRKIDSKHSKVTYIIGE